MGNILRRYEVAEDAKVDPRVRGIFLPEVMALAIAKWTPACAGSFVRGLSEKVAGVDPRVCGEFKVMQVTNQGQNSGPLRVRGIRK